MLANYQLEASPYVAQSTNHILLVALASAFVPLTQPLQPSIFMILVYFFILNTYIKRYFSNRLSTPAFSLNAQKTIHIVG